MFPRSLDIFKLVAVLILLWGVLGFSSDTSIVVDYGIHPDKIRVVLRSFSNDPIKYKVSSLKDPYGIVVDLQEDVNISEVILPKDFKHKISKQPRGVRIVLIPPEEYPYKVFSLKEPYRIVLDFMKESSNTIVAEAKEMTEAKEPIKVKNNKNSEKKKLHKKVVVVVDAGHGGKDPGAIGYGGIEEKWVNLQIAKYLANYLKKNGRFEVVMTRDGDYYLTLEERVKIAREHKADLFISIHSDAAPGGNPFARGTQVFVLSEESANRKKMQILRNAQYAFALFRDAKDTRALPILSDIAFDITLNESREFAKLLAEQLKRDMGGREITFKGITSGGFAVLKNPGTISILIEAGFITNPEESKKLADQEFQEKLARSIYKAIVRYFYGK